MLISVDVYSEENRVDFLLTPCIEEFYYEKNELLGFYTSNACPHFFVSDNKREIRYTFIEYAKMNNCLIEDIDLVPGRTYLTIKCKRIK